MATTSEGKTRKVITNTRMTEIIWIFNFFMMAKVETAIYLHRCVCVFSMNVWNKRDVTK